MQHLLCLRALKLYSSDETKIYIYDNNSHTAPGFASSHLAGFDWRAGCNIAQHSSPGSFPARLNLFATVFLEVFIEALPYLLIGTLISGLVEVFLDREQMARLISKRPGPAAVTGAFMGLLFPVCECGVIPLTRRLFHKGLPVSARIAFLLAAPVLNPIVIFSTAAAFGEALMLG
jgi:uncharacterized membrane protein YraQ (UPF0718 family)